jgi:hypothetical protein
MRSAVLLVTGLMMAPAICLAQSVSLSLNQIVSRMQQAREAERASEVAYTVKREYQLAPAGASRPSSDVVAEVSFVPPTDKQYTIVKTEGSERGASIVRRILDHEAGSGTRHDQYALTPENYDFALLGREEIDGHDCYTLQISPRREAVELIRGRAWVDTEDYMIRRIEGETSKSPSMWVKKVNLTLNFGEVSGVWLETSSEAVAQVRLAGTHVLTSKELDVRTETLNAQATKPTMQRRSRQHIVANTAAWVAH